MAFELNDFINLIHRPPPPTDRWLGIRTELSLLIV